MKNKEKEVSVIVCVLNEEDSIHLFLDEVTPVLEQHCQSYEIVFVNDGSTDSTLSQLIELASTNSKLKVINLSRNFGKDIALTAGIDHANGRAVIPMDVDLQDPPELIPEMLNKWRSGVDTVIAIREDRNDDSWLKRTSATAFYQLIGKMSHVKIPQNAGDYRLIDQKVVSVIKNMPEKRRFMKGIFAYPGFSVDTVTFTRPPRAAGTTKWNYWRLWNFALDGIFSFSTAPLRIWTYLGTCLAIASAVYMTQILVKTLIYGIDVPGYASLACLILFFNSIVLIGIGVLGEYIGRIFEEVKARPLYVIDSIHGQPSESSDAP